MKYDHVLGLTEKIPNVDKIIKKKDAKLSCDFQVTEEILCPLTEAQWVYLNA